MPYKQKRVLCKKIVKSKVQGATLHLVLATVHAKCILGGLMRYLLLTNKGPSNIAPALPVNLLYCNGVFAIQVFACCDNLRKVNARRALGSGPVNGTLWQGPYHTPCTTHYFFNFYGKAPTLAAPIHNTK